MPLNSQTLSYFLAAFYPVEQETIHLRAFAPKKAPKDEARFVARKITATRHALATDTALQEQLCQLNEARGLYFVVNAGGDTDEEITRFNAWFAEDDTRPIDEQHRRLDAAPLEPSVRVETNKSIHAYWLIKGGCEAEEWRDIQQRLIFHFGGDEKIKNPSRVMRLPFFNHVHYDKEIGTLPFKQVKLIKFSPERRYTVSEMQAAFAPWLELPSEPPIGEAQLEISGFQTWDALNAEVIRRIRSLPQAHTNSKGWTHAPGICHGSTDGKAQFVSPEGAYGCHKGCSTSQVRASHGLPECLDQPETEAITTNGQSKNVRASTFKFTTLDDLLAEPEEETAYVWDKTLPCGGFSICAAKPKVGKSTLARNLAVAISKGADFFGRETSKGTVIYLCLEEKRAEVAQHFRKMGASGAGIIIHTGSTPLDALDALEAAIKEHSPALIIIDPLSRFVRVADFNSYGEVTRGLEPLIDLARTSNCQCHIMAVHHNGKGEREGGDALLGSTGFFGAVDALLIMKRHQGARTLLTVQRYGEDLPETVAHLDIETGIVTAGGDMQTLQTDVRRTAVLDCMGDERLSEADIRERIGGNQTLTAKAIRTLYESGDLQRTGAGKRGDPYHYHKAGTNLEESRSESSILDSIDIDNRENLENPESEEPEGEPDWLADVAESDWMKDASDEVRERAAIMEIDGLQRHSYGCDLVTTMLEPSENIRF